MKLFLVIAAFIGYATAQFRNHSPPASGYSAPSPPSYGPAPSPPSHGPAPSPPSHGPTSSTSYHGSPSPSPSYGPAHSSYGSGGPSYGRHHGANILETLSSISRQVQSLEAKEAAQVSRVEALAESSNANLDLANNFRSYLQAEIDNEQNQQDHRLQALEFRLSQIEALRAQVDSLSDAADAVQGAISSEREERKQVMYNVNDLQNADSSRISRIENTEASADDVSARLDEVSDAINADSVSLTLLETNVRRVIDSVSRAQTSDGGFQLSPSEASGQSDITVSFSEAFIGTPQISGITPIGFSASLRHVYSYEYPAIVFGLTQDVWNDRVVVDSQEMSAGGWSVDKVTALQRATYFDNTLYQKSFLDGI